MPELRVFFASQSDSPAATNRNAIRNALRTAATRLQKKQPDLHIHLDEATRDTPGSPAIASTILTKIDAADIVVADITTINPNRSGGDRPCPNPNVVFELGYAAARHGWHRIITLFNSALGEFPDDLPFDLAGRRVTDYHYPKRPPPAQSPLVMYDWIVAILNSDLGNLDSAHRRGDPSTVRRERDLRNLRNLLSLLDIPYLREFLDHMPRTFQVDIAVHCDAFTAHLREPLFHLYDPLLDGPVQRLATAWDRTLAHDGEYREIPAGNRYVFRNTGDLLPARRQAIWDQIDQARKDTAHALGELLAQVRNEYVEIDLDETSRKARTFYAQYLNDDEND